MGDVERPHDEDLVTSRQAAQLIDEAHRVFRDAQGTPLEGRAYALLVRAVRFVRRVEVRP